MMDHPRQRQAWQTPGGEDLIGLLNRITRTDPALVRLAVCGLGPRAHELLALIMSWGSDLLMNIHLLLEPSEATEGRPGDSMRVRSYGRAIAMVVAHTVLGRIVHLADNLVEDYERRKRFDLDFKRPWHTNVLRRFPRGLLGALVRARVNPGPMEYLESIVREQAADRLGVPPTAHGLAQEVRRYGRLLVELATEAFEVSLGEDVWHVTWPPRPSPAAM